jgi:rhamnosyltransferase
MHTSNPIISIVVPIKNGISTLNDLIEGIKMQTLFDQTEVVIIDSASTDGSKEFLSQFDFVRVISIDPKTFNHGATRNLGVSHAKGEFILMTVQDATPVENVWLENMVSHFNDITVIGVCGQQVVPHHKNKNPHKWYRPQSQGGTLAIHFEDAIEFNNLLPKEQKKLCRWDDVNAMYRKKALVEVPFEPLAYGEDMVWAKTALQKGFKLVYDNSVPVYHYHFQFPEYTFKRTLISKLFTYRCFEYADDRTFKIKDYFLIIYRNFRWKLELKWIWHNFKILHNHRKATKTLLKGIQNNTLDELEKKLAIQIPIGKQNTKTQ